MSASFDSKKSAMSDLTSTSPQNEREANDLHLQSLITRPEVRRRLPVFSGMSSKEIEDSLLKKTGKLNPKAESFVFLPPYHPSLSMTEIGHIVRLKSLDSEELKLLLISKGYPSFWVMRLSSMNESRQFSRLDQLKGEISRRKDRSFNESGKGAKAKPSLVAQSTVRSAGNHWRIYPPASAQFVPKPTAGNFSHGSFVAWVYGKANLLRGGITAKTQYVTGNEACQVLFKNPVLHASDPAQLALLEKADVFVDDYRNFSKPRRNVMLTEYLPPLPEVKPSLVIHGVNVSSIEALSLFESSFRRHKPLFRAATALMIGQEEVDSVRLQAQIDDKINTVEMKQSGLRISSGIGFPSRLAIPVDHRISFDSDSVPQGIERVAIQVTALIAQVVSAVDWKTAALAVVQFVAGNDIASSYVKRLLQTCTEIRYQNADDDVSGEPSTWWSRPLELFRQELLEPLWEAIVGCSFITIVQEFFSSMREQLTIPIPDLVKTLKFSILKEGCASLSRSIIDGIKEIIARFKQCVQERSLNPLWGRNWNPERWMRTSEVAFIHFPSLVIAPGAMPDSDLMMKLREEGDIPITWHEPVTLKQYIEWITAHISMGGELLKYFKDAPGICVRLSKARDRLIHHLEFCTTLQTSGNARIPPVFLILFGETGVGKSNLVAQLCKAVARKRCYDESSAGVYKWLKNANFQNLSHQHWCVNFDDPGHGVAPPAAGVKNEIEEIIELVNTAPYPVEQADVSMKGKVFAAPTFVVASTNYFSMRVNALTRYPPAFWRRVSYHVEVQVRPEFCVEGGTTLDSEKVFGGATHDMYKLLVRKFDPSKVDASNVKEICLTDPVEMSFPDFVVEFLEYFDKHQSLARRVVEQHGSQGSWCFKCGLDSSRDCGHFSQPVSPLDTSFLDDQDEEKESEDSFAYWRSFKQTFSGTKVEKEKKQGLGQIIGAVATAGFGVALAAFINTRRNPQTAEEWRDWYRAAREEVRVNCATYSLAAVGGIAAKLGWFGLFTTALCIYQARENNATSGLLPMSWTRAEQTFKPGVPQSAMQSTFTKEDLIRSVKESFVEVKGVQTVHGYLLGHNSIVTVSHAVEIGKDVTIVCRGREITFPITAQNFRQCPSNPEYCTIRNGELFGGGSLSNKLWSVIDEQIQQFDEVEIWSDRLLYSPTRNQMRMHKGCRVLSTNAPTVAGDCGSVYLARFGTSWKAVAFHFAIIQTTSIMGDTSCSIGALGTSLELSRVLQTIGTTLQGVETVVCSMTKDAAMPECLPFQYKSEVWAAMSDGAEPYAIGEMFPSLSGSTLRTKIVESLMYTDVSETFEEEWCGHRGYWQVPRFRGHMEGDKWKSLWTNAWASENHVQPPEQLLILAMGDYLYGIQNLSTDGYAELSEEQALTGIPGSYINRINIKTSVGPPFNRGKRGFIHLDPGNSHMAPEVWDMFDEVQRILSLGGIPSVLGLCTAKDEPVKPGKFPRVFTNMPYVANMHMKMKGVWKSFFRANMQFFECAVGINMTSHECNKVVNILKSLDETLTRISDGDAKALDKSWSGQLYDFVCLVIYAICFAIGINAMENFSLAHGMKHTTFSMKNDLFRAFWNPSGNDWTVELNSILISLCERVIYYLHHPEGVDFEKLNKWFETFFENPIPPDCGFSFRHSIALVTYGDDKLGSFRVDLPDSYCDDWMTYLGITMTDAAKSGKMRLIPLSEASFLKRNFVWDEELQCYIPPLSVKSIARMLLMKRDSSLSALDHCAVVCSEALREAVYHGQAFFERLDKFVGEQSEKLEFAQNPYLVRRSFAFWRQQMAEGNFQTWSVREPVAPVAIGEGALVDIDEGLASDLGVLATNFVLQGKMSDVSMVKAGNDSANNQEIVQTNASGIQHDTGQMIFSSPGTFSHESGVQQFHQRMPDNTLSDFMLRATEIASFTLADTDTQGVVSTIDPWALYLANTAIVDKVANYQLIRGSLQLIFVAAIPGNAFGSYVITALPNGGSLTGTNTSVAESLVYQNCMQCDHFVRIDCASAEDGSMDLEFLWPYDYAELPAGPANSWKVSLTCLSPLDTAMPGGVVAGSIRVFAALMEDYQLVVPHLQGRPSRPSKAMQEVAPKLHNKLTKVSAGVTKVAEIAHKAESIPIIGPYAGTVEKAANVAKKALSWFGFTRPSQEELISQFATRSVSSLAHVEGQDLSSSASLMSINEISTDPLLVGVNKEDPMAFASLFNRWTLVKTMTWDGSAVVGQSLGSVPVTPMYSMGTNTTIQPTPAGYIGSLFTYWRGDMEYQIIIPVSKLHRGNLQVAWLPVGSTYTGNITNRTLNTIYDVTSGDEKTFTVGYARDFPFCRTNVITPSVSIVPYGATNGQLVFRVITPLVSPNPDAQTVSVLVFARAKANMEFAVPSNWLRYVAPDGLSVENFGIQTNVTLQGGATGDEDNHSATTVELVAASGDYPMEDLLFGERIESCRALMQKPSRNTTITNSVAATTDVVYETLPPMGFIPVNDVFSLTLGGNFTFHGYLRPLFTGISSSFRYKAISSGPMYGAFVHQTDSSGLTSVGKLLPNTLAPWTFFGPQNGAEFSVPYYSAKKFLLGREIWNATEYSRDTQVHLNQFWVSNPGSSAQKLVTYTCYGPDIRVTGFRQVPTIVLSTATTTTVPVFFNS